MSGQDNGDRRAVLTVDDSDGFAVWVTSEEKRAPLPAGVSHLLAANDALIPGRWGAHSTLCGVEVRRPDATAAEHDCDLGCDCVRYCTECVREAVRFSADSDRASDPVR